MSNIAHSKRGKCFDNILKGTLNVFIFQKAMEECNYFLKVDISDIREEISERNSHFFSTLISHEFINVFSECFKATFFVHIL